MLKEKQKFNLKKLLAVTAVTSFAFVFLFLIHINLAAASDITPQSVIQLVNKERLSQSLNILKENVLLDKAAGDKLNDMIQNNYFAHTSPRGISPWHWIEKNGYDYKYAGENLAINFTTAESQEKAWMASTSHRKNILNPNYQEIGVAVASSKIDGENGLLTVQLFGTQMKGILSVPGEETAQKEAEVKATQPEEIITKVPSPQEVPLAQNNGLVLGDKKISENIAWLIAVFVLFISITINAVTLSRKEKHNPFIAANTVILLIILTTVVFWKI